MKKTTYAIRRIDYQYGDDWMYNCGEAEYIETFYSKEEAQKRIDELERKEYRKLEIIQYLFAETNPWEKSKSLDEYLKQEFKISIKTSTDFGYNEAFKIPKNASDNQVDKIREIVNISFYTLIEFQEDNPQFIVVGLNLGYLEESNIRKSLGERFNTADEALDKALSNLLHGMKCYYGSQSCFYGKSLDELSEIPLVLEKYLASCENWHYESGSRINAKVFDEKTKEELKGLIPLLKSKPFEIKEI